MSDYTLTCNSKKVFKFYKERTGMNFEIMNELFVDILNNIYKDVDSNVNNNIANKILISLKEIEVYLATFGDTIDKRLLEFKRNYIDDVKMIVQNNSNEKIALLIKEANEILYNKTHILINELLPKENKTLSDHITKIMKSFYNEISQDTNKLLDATIDKEILQQFVNNIDNRFSSALMNSQTIMNSIITSTETRIDSKLSDIMKTNFNNQDTQTILNSNLTELLGKMNNSSHKGKMSENVVYEILCQMFPSATIRHVGSSQSHSGDILVERKGMPVILIENKLYESRNVPPEQVTKFIEDVENQNCCGLFLSQSSGISGKNNFEINIQNGNVLLYIHNCGYDADKIKIAINIIDSMKSKVEEMQYDEICNIKKEDLDAISKEYENFSIQKLAHIKFIKETSQKMIKQAEELKLPVLENYLATRYAFANSKITCDNCGFVAKNQGSLSAHKRGCRLKAPELEDAEILSRLQNGLTDIDRSRIPQNPALDVTTQSKSRRTTTKTNTTK